MVLSTHLTLSLLALSCKWKVIWVVKAVFQVEGCAGTATTPDGFCRLSHTYRSPAIFMLLQFFSFWLSLFFLLYYSFPLAHNSSFFPVPYYIISPQSFISFFCVLFYVHSYAILIPFLHDSFVFFFNVILNVLV